MPCRSFIVLLLFLRSSSPLTFLLNKPPNTLCSHSDPTSSVPTVYSLLPASPKKWHTVGRLDKKTTGALLCTTDTKLVEYGTSGSVEKRYRAVCMGRLSEEQVCSLREGIDLKGGLGFSDACEVDVLDIGKRNTVLEICLRQGKNRQIRRMLHEVGSGVIDLERVKIGGLVLGDLERGEFREVNEEELKETIGYG